MFYAYLAYPQPDTAARQWPDDFADATPGEVQSFGSLRQRNDFVARGFLRLGDNYLSITELTTEEARHLRARGVPVW